MARVIKTLSGEPYQSFAGKSVLLSQRLPGRHVYNPTRKQVRALGICKTAIELKDEKEQVD